MSTIGARSREYPSDQYNDNQKEFIGKFFGYAAV